jgi:hypothetical protein
MRQSIDMDLNQDASVDNEPYEGYPAWIGHELINDSLPWDQAQNLSFEQFFQGCYTLHDSALVDDGIFEDGIFHDELTQTVTLAICWDMVWLPERITQNISEDVGFVFLFIRFWQVTEVSTLQYNGAEFNCILSHADEAIDGVRLLSIDLIGSRVYITYQGVPEFLAMTDDKKVLALSIPDEIIT